MSAADSRSSLPHEMIWFPTRRRRLSSTPTSTYASQARASNVVAEWRKSVLLPRSARDTRSSRAPTSHVKRSLSFSPASSSAQVRHSTTSFGPTESAQLVSAPPRVSSIALQRRGRSRGGASEGDGTGGGVGGASGSRMTSSPALLLDGAGADAEAGRSGGSARTGWTTWRGRTRSTSDTCEPLVAISGPAPRAERRSRAGRTSRPRRRSRDRSGGACARSPCGSRR